MTNTPKPEALASLVERLNIMAGPLSPHERKTRAEETAAEAATAITTLAAERDALREAVIQYRDDLRHPPAPDSKERRLEMIAKLIGKD